MDLIKALASPAAPSVPESRQLVVDASAMDDMMQQIAESVTPWQARTDSDDEGNVLDTVEHGEEVDNVNGAGLDATRVIELLQKAASPIDSTVQSAYETRTIDSASLQNVYDKLIPLLSPSAASAHSFVTRAAATTPRTASRMASVAFSTPPALAKISSASASGMSIRDANCEAPSEMARIRCLEDVSATATA